MTWTPPTMEVTPEFKPYLDITDDVRPWLQLPEGPEPIIDAKLRRVTNAICRRTQNYLGRALAPLRYFKRFSGWPGANGAVIMLPFVPVLKVLHVVEYRGSTGRFELAEQTPETGQGNSETFQIEPLTGALVRTFMGNLQRPWFPGSKNIEVEWEAGFNPIPEDIELATLEYIKKWWDSTQQSSRVAPQAAALGYGGEVTPNTAGAGGELQRTLDTYLQQGIG